MNTTETFVPIEGFEGYQIGNLGTVINVKFKNQLTGALCKDDYLQVNLCKNGLSNKKLIHRLVAEHFIPMPESEEKLYVDHKDDNRLNNRADNLQWLTHKENVRKSVLAGRRRTTLTWADIPVIKEKFASGINAKTLAAEYKVSAGTITNVVYGKTWTQQ